MCDYDVNWLTCILFEQQHYGAMVLLTLNIIMSKLYAWSQLTGMGAQLWDVEEGNCRVPQTLLQQSKVLGYDDWVCFSCSYTCSNFLFGTLQIWS